jgi:RNA polymerase sigma-70 factor (ECF subfamily)
MDASCLREEFEAVALPHLDAVYRMARSLAANEAEAEDLAQETFVRAFRAFAKFELREHGAKPWLMKILYNAFYTLKGKQRRDPALLNEGDFDRFREEPSTTGLEPTSVEEIDWNQFDEELKIDVQELQPEYRSTLLLWAIEGLSYKEIAEVCECPLGTVMSRLYRSRQLLAEKLRDYAKDRNLPGQRADG